MKSPLTKSRIVAMGALAAVAAWGATALAATPEERAKCEAMFKQMGLDEKGREKSGAPFPMTAEHQRCKDILAEPHHEHKEGDKHDQK